MDENLQHPQDLRRCFVIGNDEPKFSLLCSGLFGNFERALVCINNLYIYIYTYTNTLASTASIYLIFIYLVIVFFVVISLYIFIELYGSAGLLYIWLCASPPASR